MTVSTVDCLAIEIQSIWTGEKSPKPNMFE